MLISTRSIVFLFCLIVLVASTIGLIQSLPAIWDVFGPRFTGKIPPVQKSAFDEPGFLPTILEAKSEIRPGDGFPITIRGEKYQDFDKSIKVTYKIQALDTSFVKSVSPLQQSADIDAQTGYILPPIEFQVETNPIDKPPSRVEFLVTQNLSDGENTLVSNPTSLPINIDNTPFPTRDVIKAAISLVTFLMSTIGTKLARG